MYALHSLKYHDHMDAWFIAKRQQPNQPANRNFRNVICNEETNIYGNTWNCFMILLSNVITFR